MITLYAYVFKKGRTVRVVVYKKKSDPYLKVKFALKNSHELIVSAKKKLKQNAKKCKLIAKITFFVKSANIQISSGRFLNQILNIAFI